METLIQQKGNKRMLYSIALLTLLTISGISYYYYLSRYEDGIIPPLGKSTPFVYKTFDAEKGVEFHQPTGTHIVIPANALVDEEGKKVTGKVTMKFREFQNAREIFLSGIPMQLKEDRSDYFSSAGMMELRVFKNNKALQLAKNKEVAVELASAIQPTADYKLYELENDVAWDNGTTFETTKNTRRDEALAALPALPAAPINPQIDSSKFIFELISDYGKMPHLKSWKNIKWRFIESDDELKPQEALRISWDKIAIEPLNEEENTFNLKFSVKMMTYNSKMITKTYSMVASPELTGKKLEVAMKKYQENLDAYKIEFAKIEEEEERLMLESGILNVFIVSNFGIFNIDCLKTDNILATVDMNFDFEEEVSPKLNKVMLYLVLHKERSVVKFNAFDWDNIPIAKSDCSLVAMLPNGKVAYVSKENFQKTIDKFNKLITGMVINFKTERKEYDEIADLFKTPSDESRLN